jgi:hypothetical protein
MMSDDQTIHFFLEEPLRKSAESGAHNFISLIGKVVTKARFRVEYHGLLATNTAATQHSLSHMVNPPNDKGLVFRRVYHYPFWQIDAVAQRWHWDVARAAFDPATASNDAQRFYRFWQKRLFGDAPQKTSRDGFVYVPLQGQIQRRRLFQSCTPLEMIEHTVAFSGRKVVATLHPKETYDQSDRAALSALAKKNPQLTIVTGDMVHYLQGCDYVVTQNSGVAFSGFFFGKPALLFGQIDFHHITVSADLNALGKSFDQVATLAPDYDKYIWWFWQDQSINAGRDDAEAKITARLRRFGWAV